MFCVRSSETDENIGSDIVDNEEYRRKGCTILMPYDEMDKYYTSTQYSSPSIETFRRDVS